MNTENCFFSCLQYKLHLIIIQLQTNIKIIGTMVFVIVNT